MRKCKVVAAAPSIVNYMDRLVFYLSGHSHFTLYKNKIETGHEKFTSGQEGGDKK